MPNDNLMMILMFVILLAAGLSVLVIGKVGVIKKWDAATVVRRQIIGIYIAYIFTLFVITVLARGERGDDLPDIFIPFYEFYLIIKNGYPWYYDNILLLTIVNILLFIPYGILSHEWMKSKWLLPIISGFALSLIIEIIQMLTDRGIFDITDIMLNTLGVAAGCGICVLCKKIWSKATKKD